MLSLQLLKKRFSTARQKVSGSFCYSCGSRSHWDVIFMLLSTCLMKCLFKIIYLSTGLWGWRLTYVVRRPQPIVVSYNSWQQVQLINGHVHRCCIASFSCDCFDHGSQALRVGAFSFTVWIILILLCFVPFAVQRRMDVAEFLLDGNADAVEFCPYDTFHDILVAATYTLQEGDEPCRLGGISIFSVMHGSGLRALQHIKTTGIFDIKWNPCQGHNLLAEANSGGFLRLHALNCKFDVAEAAAEVLSEVVRKDVSSSMCLCLDWSLSASFIAVGLSDGSVSIVTTGEAQLEIIKHWQAHDFELWAAAFDDHHNQLLYTGADDCKFSCWDLRESTSEMIFQNSKAHKMGVCCIQKNPMNANLLLTGSYDESLRLWDVRSTSTPVMDHHISLGGGVWKFKHHPHKPGLVLAACMHNGFAVVRIKEDGMEVLENYQKHESLAYGADWYRGKFHLKRETRTSSLVATCSFYDRRLRLWVPNALSDDVPDE